jgi:hypothetical protein
VVFGEVSPQEYSERAPACEAPPEKAVSPSGAAEFSASGSDDLIRASQDKSEIAWRAAARVVQRFRARLGQVEVGAVRDHGHAVGRITSFRDALLHSW